MTDKLFILIEDNYGDKVWKQVSEVNLGSCVHPNKQVLEVKIISQ